MTLCGYLWCAVNVCALNLLQRNNAIIYSHIIGRLPNDIVIGRENTTDLLHTVRMLPFMELSFSLQICVDPSIAYITPNPRLYLK